MVIRFEVKIDKLTDQSIKCPSTEINTCKENAQQVNEHAKGDSPVTTMVAV